MRVRYVAPLLAVALATPLVAADRSEKSGRPHLQLRTTPRFAFGPVNVLATAELVGGRDAEEFHCPTIEWEWGDGSRSERQADCEPFADYKSDPFSRFMTYPL